jgi:hypothetical protein
LINSAIGPLTKSFSSHFTLNPFALILPALSRAYKEPNSLLESIDIVAFIKIPVLPLPYAATVRESVFELTKIDLTFAKSQLTSTVHSALVPVALVYLAIGLRPVLFSKAMWLAFDQGALVD